MARAVLVLLFVALVAFGLVAAPADARPVPDVCDLWPGAPYVCWDPGNGCPPPPYYCQPP
ncbi:MAG TPA: hypothetical protein VI997_03340 [Candidatus Thermoplasmatota archaeon]|nr:hypothetical protein [Candidatus Thermoplasmatota archaeon]